MQLRSFGHTIWHGAPRWDPARDAARDDEHAAFLIALESRQNSVHEMHLRLDVDGIGAIPVIDCGS